MWSKFWEPLTIATPSSSEAHLNTQLTNGAIEIAGQVVQGVAGSANPWANIGPSFGQAFVSFFSIFRNGTLPYEKLILLWQTALSITETGLSIYLVFDGETCGTDFTNNVCTAFLVCKTLSNTTLVVSGTVAKLLGPNSTSASNTSTTARATAQVQSQGHEEGEKEEEVEDESEDEDEEKGTRLNKMG
ncbi:hypothetical protein Lnau_1020 [Legionella nautarum]|uniref:Uncharacterized protein n=1 Tax=Legionella nautarum TaxID=45070 RepID=A0A0W0WUS0_9GAMM|nr:hypothetical protein [Legionella nautarum]KTD36036.1 hypothetical protein Lnau_1020 [Legionella nautarum]